MSYINFLAARTVYWIFLILSVTHLENIYTSNVSLSHILDVICLISNSRNAILKGNNVKIEE